MSKAKNLNAKNNLLDSFYLVMCKNNLLFNLLKAKLRYAELEIHSKYE